MASVAALGVAAFAPPARAGDIVLFNPTGAGTAPGSVLNVSSFQYLAGNTLAINGGSLAVGDSIHLVYQAILGTINTSGGNGAGTANANTGNIIDNGVTTNVQIVIEAQFNETVTSLVGNTAVFAFNPSLVPGPNAVNLYAQSAIAANSASLNDGLGAGFTGNAPVRVNILTGAITASGFSSSFTAVTPGDPTSYLPLDSHAGGNTPPSLGTIPTIQGSGNTSLTVAVNTALTNLGYFPTPPTVIQLNFNTISAGTPFRAAEPETVMFQGTTNSLANLGPVNSQGADFLFQSQANNDFTVAQAVPEPGMLATALTGIGLAFLARLRAQRRQQIVAALK